MIMLIKQYFSLHRKFLVYNLMSRNLKIRYRKSLLGMMWTVLIPAFSSLVYYFVFENILQVKVENYFVLITLGVIPWAFFVSAISTSTEIIVVNYGLLNKCPLPVQSLVLAEVSTFFLNLLLSIPVIICIQAFSGLGFSLANIQALAIFGFLYAITYGLAIILSFMYVFLRDLKHLVSLLLQLWFYVTPIMYDSKMIPEKYRFVLSLNPLGMIFDGLHKSIISAQWLSFTDWLPVLIWTLAINIVGVFIVKKYSATLVEIV